MLPISFAKAGQAIFKVTKNGLKVLSKNSNLVLTIVSATGVILTTVVAIRGTIKAVKLCEEKKVVGAKEVIKTVWKCYIPTVGMVILTTTAIISNGRINAKRIAVLTSALSGTTEVLKKVEEKMTEEIGPKKTQKAMDQADASIAQEHAPKEKDEIIATGHGNKLFYLRSTGQWFYSDWNGVELAEMKVNKEIKKMQSSSFENYYLVESALEELGIQEKTEMGEYMGWDVDDFKDGKELHFYISSDWMDLPWGRETVGIVRFDPWPVNI